MTASVTTSVDEGVLVVRLDDGKMNAISHGVIEQLHAALDLATTDAQAVCLVGNDRALSAGFDLAVMGESAVAARELVEAGARFLMRLYAHPQPTVVAVTGHALAAGALLVLSCDTRVAADKPSKIGLNEVAIGMRLPVFAIELARDRLSKRYAGRATLQAEIFDPNGAKAAGYVDGVVEETACVESAVGEARRLSHLPAAAYAGSKQVLRQAMIEHVLTTLEEDMDRITGPA